MKQFFDLSTADQLEAGGVDWWSSKQDLILFLRWIYAEKLTGPDGSLPSNRALLSLASVAGRLGLEYLHDDILDALELSHSRKRWAECASVSCWSQWNRPATNEDHRFWKTRHQYLLARAAADLTVDHLVENLVPANLTIKMLYTLKRCQGVRSAGGQPFPFHIMKRFYLSDLPGDTIAFPIDLSTTEMDGAMVNVKEEKAHREHLFPCRDLEN